MKHKFFVTVLSLAIHSSLFAGDPVTDRQAARLLDQGAWGPTPQDIATVQALGFTEWINAQFTLNSSNLLDQPILDVNGKSNTNLAPLRSLFFDNTVAGQDQLRQRVAFALSEIWVVSQASGVSPAYAYPPYWRILHDDAFKNYADIINDMTLSPAMGGI